MIGKRLSDLLPPQEQEPTFEQIWGEPEPAHLRHPHHSTRCDVCTAADLAIRGVMASKLTPEQLHASCREPGECSCGCEWSRGARCVNCRRNRTTHQLRWDRHECLDVTDCGAAMLRNAPPVKKTPRKVSS